MLLLNVRNRNNTLNWDAVPNDVIRVIIKQCSTEQKCALLDVNRRFRKLVLENSPDLLLINRMRKSMPKIDTSESIIDNLDLISNKIEFIPFIGRVFSVIRCLAGCFLTVGYECAKQSKSDPIDIRICQMNQKRAARNIEGGNTRALPFYGIIHNAMYMRELSLDKIQAHAVKCLLEVRTYSMWTKHVRSKLLPSIVSQEKRVALTTLFHKIPSKKYLNGKIIFWTDAYMDESLRRQHSELLIQIYGIAVAAMEIEHELMDKSIEYF